MLVKHKLSRSCFSFKISGGMHFIKVRFPIILFHIWQAQAVHYLRKDVYIEI